MLGFVDGRHFYLLVLGYHGMFEVPTCSAGQLSDDNVAVAEQVDVEGNVMDRLWYC